MHGQYFVILGILGVVIVLATILPELLQRSGTGEVPYQRHDSLLTPAERSFYGVLERAIARHVTPMAKVRLADIIKVEGSISAARRRSAFNRIQSKHVDFVLCDAATFRVLCVVELDDKSHSRSDRKSRDAFVNRALGAAGIPIVHLPAQQSYTKSSNYLDLI
jgi:hypothetical protein